MPQESDGNRPPEKVDSNPASGNRRRRNRKKPNDANRADHAREVFKGNIPGMEENVFDISQGRGPDQFPTVMYKLAIYFGGSIPDGGMLTRALDPNVLSLPEITRPQPPDNPENIVEMEEFKMDLKEWREDRRASKKATDAAYAKLLGQCSPAVHDRLETYESFTSIKASLDVIGLAKLIQLSLYSGPSLGDSGITYMEAEDKLLNFKQNRRMSNAKYLEHFKSRAQVFEHLGGEPGITERRISEYCQEHDISEGSDMTDATRARVVEAVKEAYLAQLFLNNSHTRFRVYVAELKFKHGLQQGDSDIFPNTLSQAYTYLENWDELIKIVQQSRQVTYHAHQESGMSYNTQDDNDESPSDDRNVQYRGNDNAGRGRGSYNQGRGRGAGRGGRGYDHTRGNARAYKTEDEEIQDSPSATVHFQDNDGSNNSSNSFVNNYNIVPDPEPSCYSMERAQRMSNPHNALRTLIVDSASTSDIFACSEIVHDIHDSINPLNVRSLNGSTLITQQAYLGNYPPPVWFYPQGGVNILSLNNLQYYYRCTMDTEKENAIRVHMRNGKQLKFTATGKGIYEYALKPFETAEGLYSTFITVSRSPHNYCFSIDTVDKRADRYTKRQVKRAILARRLENIVMRPGSRRFTDTCIPHLKDCPLTAADARAANDILGRNLGSIKGKTVFRPNPHVGAHIDPVPQDIHQVHKQVTLAIDIMYINKIAFLVTLTRNLKFGTVEALPDRKITTIVEKIRSVTYMYHHRGFSVTGILADNEFEPLRPWFPSLNTCSAGEHIPDIERYIRTIKDSTRSTYRMLPFTHVPRLVLIHLVKNSVFWLNAFPAADGVSSVHSPRYIMTGFELNYKLHAKLPFGSYVQTHEDHTNNMDQRTMGAICLGPNGNQQGGHWFMSLASGARVVRHRWTELPMPAEAIQRVNAIGIQQRMPTKLTYANRYGREIEDSLDDIHHYDSDADDDSSYSPSIASSTDSSDASSTGSDDSSFNLDDYDSADDNHTDDDTDDDDSDDDDDDGENQPPSLPTPSNDRELRVGLPDVPPDTPVPRSSRPFTGVRQSPRMAAAATPSTETNHEHTQTPRTTGVSNNTRDGQITGVDDQITGVDDQNTGVTADDQNTGVNDQPITPPPVTTTDQQPLEEHVQEMEQQLDQAIRDITQDQQDATPHQSEDNPSVNEHDDEEQEGPTAEEIIRQAEQEGRNRAIRNDSERPRRNRKSTRTRNEYVYLLENPIEHRQRFDALVDMIGDHNPIKIIETMKNGSWKEAVTLLTEQMSARKGLKMFGNNGAEAIKKELEQLVYRKVMHGKKAQELTREHKRAALRYLMFLKQKRCGKIKGRGCADGRKQRVYKTKEETSSPTIHVESLFLTSIIDALEGRKVVTLDIPGAFMQADIDELIHVKLEGEIADLLVRADPSYAQFVTYENNKKVIYTELDKALYGTLQAALLFWQKLSKYLKEKLGFEENPYDSCVMNKEINGSQATIGWHVDDVKMSHKEQAVLEDIIRSLSSEFGKEAPLTITRGDTHEYLGMTIDFSQPGKVIFSMLDYVDRLIADAPEDLLKGECCSPAANHIFQVNDKCPKLDPATAILYHHLTAQLLYLAKRTRPDLLLAVSFLCTRVQSPDEDDWKKLGRCVRFLRETKKDKLTLQANSKRAVQWWIDASFAVHPNMRSHTGATMTMGKGSPISISSKQKLNTRSSTEVELVGVNDAMYMVLWVRHFLEAQGYNIRDNIVYQDNQSAMRLEKNGKMSSTKNTRHIEIRYFFVTDNIRRGKLSIEYCPTDDMLGDYFTKPQQGSKMRRSRVSILNLSDSSIVPQECVGAQEQKLNRLSSDGQNNRIMTNNCKDDVSTVQTDPHGCSSTKTTVEYEPAGRIKNTMKRQAKSYLMAAKGIMNKVSGSSHFVQLTLK